MMEGATILFFQLQEDHMLHTYPNKKNSCHFKNIKRHIFFTLFDVKSNVMSCLCKFLIDLLRTSELIKNTPVDVIYCFQKQSKQFLEIQYVDVLLVPANELFQKPSDC